MELQYYGGNCLKITTKKAVIVIDDNLEALGQKSITKTGNIAIYSQKVLAPKAPLTDIIFDQPGEYEISDVAIQGIQARAHTDDASAKTATIFKLEAEDIRLAVLGHIYPEIADDQLEALGTIDVLILPVGGNGYTLDSLGAIKLIKDIEPKIVIPTHFDDRSLKYPVPQQTLEQALKGLALEPKETTDKLKLKSLELGETTQLIVLTRQ